MKISKIEFENFRNFKDHGEIRCSTDGKVTIIYGRNGDGKTTLHQLFQWVFYGKVHFNKTTTDRLYNHQYESEAALGEEFPVLGCIDFEHEGKKYSARRVYTYKKGLQESIKVAEDFSVSVEDEDHKEGMSGASNLFYKTYDLYKNNPCKFQNICDEFFDEYK